MRTLRVVVVAALLAGGLAVLAAGANASVPAISAKTCRSLRRINDKPFKVMQEMAFNFQYDAREFTKVSKAFRKGLKTAPESLKPPMTTFADEAAKLAAAGSFAAAAAELKQDQGTLIGAALAWTGYLTKNCPFRPSG